MIDPAIAMRSVIRNASQMACGLVLAVASLVPASAQSPAASAPTSQPSSSWQRLSAEEKRALAPLASRWSELSEIQKGKWIAIAHNFDQLSATEKTVMHARMTEWVNLSPIQRSQARLNFNTLQNLPKDEKKAKWDEYQSLSPEQKRQLSAINQGPSKTAAPSSKPANADRLVTPPRAWQASPASSAPPNRAPIDKKTLLPLTGDATSKPVTLQPEASSPREDGSPS